MKCLFLLGLSLLGSVALSAQVSQVSRGDSLKELLRMKTEERQVLSAEIQKLSSGNLLFSTKKLDKKMADAERLRQEIRLLEEEISAESRAPGYYKRLDLKNETPDTITVKVLDYVRFMNWYNAEQLRVEQELEAITNADERYRRRNQYRGLGDLVAREHTLTYENVYAVIGDKTPYLEMRVPPLPKKELTPYEQELFIKQKEKEAMIAGWEWVNDGDKAHWEEKKVAYPETYGFYVHKDHPEYRVKFRNLADEALFPLVFKDDELIRVNEINRDYLPMERIKKAVFRKDFLANKYNVTDENVREFIKLHLGMPGKMDAVGEAAIGQIRQHRAERAEATTSREMRRAEVAEAKVREAMEAMMSTKEFELAANYMKQLELDHEKDWEIASVTRRSGTSFEVVSVSGMRILLTFFAEISSHKNYSDVKVEIL